MIKGWLPAGTFNALPQENLFKQPAMTRGPRRIKR